MSIYIYTYIYIYIYISLYICIYIYIVYYLLSDLLSNRSSYCEASYSLYKLLQQLSNSESCFAPPFGNAQRWPEPGWL